MARWSTDPCGRPKTTRLRKNGRNSAHGGTVIPAEKSSATAVMRSHEGHNTQRRIVDRAPGATQMVRTGAGTGTPPTLQTRRGQLPEERPDDEPEEGRFGECSDEARLVERRALLGQESHEGVGRYAHEHPAVDLRALF